MLIVTEHVHVHAWTCCSVINHLLTFRLMSPLPQLWFQWSTIRRQYQHWSKQWPWDPLTPLQGSVLYMCKCILKNGWMYVLISVSGTSHMSCGIPLTRCKQINLRRLLCDWTHYEDDIRTLQDIVQQQVSHSEEFLQSGQLPCHSPGNLLHFPLTLEQVSWNVIILPQHKLNIMCLFY